MASARRVEQHRPEGAPILPGADGPHTRAEAADRRLAASNRWRPAHVSLLLVAETPPTALDRYFYFTDVALHDSLFRHVTQGILGGTRSRSDKQDGLQALRDRGVSLIDLKADPFDPGPLRFWASDLRDRCRSLVPDCIILIKATVYDAAFGPLQDAGLPGVNRRIPFPGSGRQVEFRQEFRLALRDFGLQALPEASEPTRSVLEPTAGKTDDDNAPRGGRADPA